jgi:hypothetical protein
VARCAPSASQQPLPQLLAAQLGYASCIACKLANAAKTDVSTYGLQLLRSCHQCLLACTYACCCCCCRPPELLLGLLLLLPSPGRPWAVH